MKLPIVLESRMDEVLALLKEFLASKAVVSQDAEWCLQSGGNTNRVWRVSGDRPLICKLYSTNGGSFLFPNDPLVELASLKAYSMAPDPVDLFDTPAGPCLVYRYIEGEVWKDDVSSVAVLMRKVWDLPAVSDLRVVVQEPEAVLAEGDAILRRMRNVPERLSRLRPELFEVSAVEPAVVHTDIIPQNLIQTDAGLRLIDWQCPALGDPIIDVATFLSPAMQTVYRGQPLSNELCTAFLADLPKPVASRYSQIGKYYHWRLACHAAWRAEQGKAAYADAWQAECALLELL